MTHTNVKFNLMREPIRYYSQFKGSLKKAAGIGQSGIYFNEFTNRYKTDFIHLRI